MCGLTQSMEGGEGAQTVHRGEQVSGRPVTLEYVLPHVEGIVSVVGKEVRVGIPAWGGGKEEEEKRNLSI